MSDRFHIATEQFQGPLEALLDMIEGRKLSISDVSLAEVTDAYLAYVEKLPELPLGETSQFILVASTLLLIKSRTLLPELALTEEERESVEELERRLARYAMVRATAKQLRARWGAAPFRFPHRAPQRPALFAPAEASINSLHAAAVRLLHMLPKPSELARAAIAPVVALEDVIENLRGRLVRNIRVRFSEMVRKGDKPSAIVHFLAILELVRSGSASVTQEKLFDDIAVEIEQVAAPRYGA